MDPHGRDRVWRSQGYEGPGDGGKRDGVEGKGRQEGGRDGRGGKEEGEQEGGRDVRERGEGGGREGWRMKEVRREGGEGGRYHLPFVTRCFRVPHRGLRVCPNAVRLEHNQQQAANSHIPTNPCEHMAKWATQARAK